MRTQKNTAVKLDWPGALLTTVGLGGIVYALIESARYCGCDRCGGAGRVLCLSRAAPGRLCFPWRYSAPGDFLGANLLTLFLYAALGGVLFFLPLDLIQVQGYTPIQAGGALLPFILLDVPALAMVWRAVAAVRLPGCP